MPHVITPECCSDASCVQVCPVNAIHPAPNEPDFGMTEMLYIDPQTCIDCGACVDACPIGVIFDGAQLGGAQKKFAEVNANYFERERPLLPLYVLPPARTPEPARLRVAIVGAGPSGHFVAEELLRRADVTIDIFDRDEVPFGLARTGVAADHVRTRMMQREFDRIGRDPRVSYKLGVNVGIDIPMNALREEYDAVFLAHGASQSRRLPVDGADAVNVVGAVDFAQWYNGAGIAPFEEGLRPRKLVVVGGGNVALDIARMVLLDEPELAASDAPAAVVDTIAAWGLREVDVLIRGGIGDAAFTVGQFVALEGLHGVAIDIANDDVDRAVRDGVAHDPSSDYGQKVAAAAGYSRAPRATGDKVLRFRFHTGTQAVLSDTEGRVRGLRVSSDSAGEADLDADLVVVALGSRPEVIDGAPTIGDQGIVCHTEGRVTDSVQGSPLRGLYVVGWAGGGARGGIGSHRTGADRCVSAFIEDFIPETVGATTPASTSTTRGEHHVAG
ncbi:FAD-dependent oxidoreductase [Microbacterium sediminicola]|uniref:ferredoxin--NADP(+) reductase n=1 Tax=Microbacterium sediminicola TaxID=415210 RepID=A0ABN2II74_9MICO